MLRNKLMTACSVAVLTVALYGCSSSSDDGANMQVQDLQDQVAALNAELGEGEELTPEALAALIQAKADAEAALADAMIAHQAALAAAAMEAETAKTAALAAAAMEAMTAHEAALAAAAIAAADMAAADKQEALDAAKMAADAAQVVALDAAKMAADAAQVVALDAAKMAADAAQVVALDAAKMAADAAQVVALDAAKVIADAALKVVQDELDGLKIDTADAMTAAALVEKIARASKVHDAIGLDTGAAKATPTGGDVGAVTAKRNAAGMVTVDVNGDADDDYAGGETNAGSSAWNSVTMTKTNANDSTDMVVIYTDIEAPSDKKFSVAYNDTMLGDALHAERVAKVMSVGFPSEAGTTWDYTGADGGRATTVTGTFDGVPGDFTCSMPPCEVMTDSDGKLVASMDWRFTADSQNTATVKDPDKAYAYFGWWLNKPVKPTDPHMVEVFAGGVGTAAAVEDDIEGTARYMGPAAGKYATKTFTAGVQTDAAVGHFTATANLTAKFGDATEDGSIGGSVTGFELDDTTPASWSVTLETAEFMSNVATLHRYHRGELRRWCYRLRKKASGTGRARSTMPHPPTPAGGAPGTVVGTFGAETANASLLGAFGASKQ